MSYTRTIEKFNEQGDRGSARSDYRCAAQGCPNMGGINGRFGADRSGVCFYHYQADALAWPEVTRRIESDDRMRDRAAVRGFVAGQGDTAGQAEMRKRMKVGVAADVLQEAA
jgi:hypothetical protein